MSTIDGHRSGASIANEIMILVRQTSQETERDGRETARAEEKNELDLGLEQAARMHDAASRTREGALVSGATMIVSGGLQGLALCSLAHAQGDQAIKVAEGKLSLARQLSEMSSSENQLFQAAAKDQDANGEVAAARARAAGHRADEAHESVRAAREVDSSVSETYKEIMRSQHDNIMATLASRG